MKEGEINNIYTAEENKKIAVITEKKDSTDTSLTSANKPGLISPQETASAKKSIEQPLITKIKPKPDSIQGFAYHSTGSSKVRVIKNAAGVEDKKKYADEDAALIASTPAQNNADNAATGDAKEPGK